jgi:hypothetical protein
MGQPRIGATRFQSSARYSHDVDACRQGDDDADSDESVERRSIAAATVPGKTNSFRYAPRYFLTESLEDAEPVP